MLKIQEQAKAKDYLNHGEKLANKGKLNQAIEKYQQALQLNPDLPFWHYVRLGKLLKQQNRCEEAANYLKSSKEGKTYLNIWQLLNKPNLEEVANERNNFTTELNQNLVSQYFKLTSQYKIIDLNKLSPEDESFIEANNLSSVNLKIAIDDDAKQQEFYLKEFNYDIKILPNDLPPNSEFPSKKHLLFQEAMVETGYIYCPCPFTGKTLRSNQSFLVGHPRLGFYRFISGDQKQVFYLITTPADSHRSMIYFPLLELIVKKRSINKIEKQIDNHINSWKSWAVVFWRKITTNIMYKGAREVVLLLGVRRNFAHCLINDLAAIKRLSITRRLNKVDKILVGPHEYYGKVEEIFPEIPAEKVIRLSDLNEKTIPQIILSNNYFALYAADYLVPEILADDIEQFSLKSCDSSFLSQVEEAKKKFPLIMISLRSHRRVWASQIEGIANIISKLAREFPSLGVVFDGFSLADSHTDNQEEYQGFVKEQIEQEKDLVGKILALIPEQQIGIYEAIGCRVHESIVWANAIDFYIANLGSNMTKVCTLANKPGIGHSNTKYSNGSGKTWFEITRENAVLPNIVPAEQIIDLEPEKGINGDYELDWRFICDESIKLIPQLSREPY